MVANILTTIIILLQAKNFLLEGGRRQVVRQSFVAALVVGSIPIVRLEKKGYIAQWIRVYGYEP